MEPFKKDDKSFRSLSLSLSLLVWLNLGILANLETPFHFVWLG